MIDFSKHLGVISILRRGGFVDGSTNVTYVFVVGVLAAIVSTILAAAFLLGCGGGWTAQDTKNVTDNARAQMLIEQMCSDAGRCDPAQVRALERSALCNSESMLFEHEQPLPEAGTQCQPR